MAEEENIPIAELIASLGSGSIIAAAGCGKTEQVALATKAGKGRRLILTHTHAGVDAITQRLKEHGVPRSRYRIDTIAGWCLRYAASFPQRAGLSIREPKRNEDWQAVYRAADQLIRMGAVDRVLEASYVGVLVDEYQDCNADQHAVIASIAKRLPVCVFGDHLQAIFDFGGQRPVDWVADVFPTFPEVARLTKPWRWHKAGNTDLANWLEQVRTNLEQGRALDFRTRPACVTWKWLPDQDGPRRGTIIGACQSAMQLDGRLIVIADPVNLDGRALIAKGLAKQGFSNIEPVTCKNLFADAKRLDSASGALRLSVMLDFLCRCMSGVNRAAFDGAITSRKAGGKKGWAEFGTLIDVGEALDAGGGDQFYLELLEGFERKPSTYVFRKEMLYSMRSALKMRLAGESVSFVDALWHVQNRVRHAGRYIARRSVGSTLLVKGLEFEHAVVVHSANMSSKDWYVALTRATHTITVLSPSDNFRPPAQ